MKIKLRDMTEEQYKKWKKKNCLHSSCCGNCLFNNTRCNSDLNSCWVHHKDLYSDKFLDQEIEDKILDTDKSILEIKEKIYLESTFKPFKNDIQVVVKCKNESWGQEQEEIIKFKVSKRKWRSLFPFSEGKMYKGMELGKEYTLKELGLFEDDK